MWFWRRRVLVMHARWWLRGIVSLTFATVANVTVLAQASATLFGTVVDSTGAVLPGADVTVTSAETLSVRSVVAEKDGTFIVTALPPGRYVVRAVLSGFAVRELSNIVLNINDRVEVRVEMGLAGLGERLTVKADTLRIRTSPAVSTVVDRQFVENLPLNGRSFQALLALTPGVVQTNAGTAQEGGQFSVNGQRASANYFLIDGVSANAGMSSVTQNNFVPGQSGSGSLPALTALGGTTGLVPVDALQEFRVQTSTYAPEFGRMPGAQISMVTRSGTNQYRGSLFEYFRHESMDANDWFLNRSGFPKQKLRQHDFGGVLGGPIVRNRIFAFGAYEGLRLLLPQTKSTTVPSLATRQSALAEIRPYLSAFPLPNGPDNTNGQAQFIASYSDPSQVDSTSIRVDHTNGGGLTTFVRVSHAPSYSQTRQTTSAANNVTTHQNNSSVTVGTTWAVSSRLVHDLRINYTDNDAPSFATLDDFGGAVPLPTSIFGPELSADTGMFWFATSGGFWQWGRLSALKQRQLNIVDSVTLNTARHDWKFGVDYRRMNPRFGGDFGYELLNIQFAGLTTGTGTYVRNVNDPANRAAVFDNLSLYAQDNWRISPRLTVTYGVRWEWVPPPDAAEGEQAATLKSLSNPYSGRLELAPAGTPLWKKRYDNIAPRVGASYLFVDKPAYRLMLKGGYGLFYDLGYGQVASAYRSYPFNVQKSESIRLPLTAANLVPPQLGVTPPSVLWVMDPSLELPVTHQWNASLDQSLGDHETLTLSYVGAAGRNLLKYERYNVPMLNWPNSVVRLNVNRNLAYSNYHGLQVQYQRRLSAGLQALASYTLSHARDISSVDGSALSIPDDLLSQDVDYGYADFDVRHVASAALTYQLPGTQGKSLLAQVTRDWGLDLLIRARSGFPVRVALNLPFPPDNVTVRPNVVPGQPFWIDDATAPGGRRLNPQAFTVPAAGTQGNLPRGVVRGFGAHQADLALRRDFAITPRLRLQIRGEFFNLLNTANFDDPNPTLTAGSFGLASQMLNRGLGGLNALYQLGGPRSTQLSMKLTF